MTRTVLAGTGIVGCRVIRLLADPDLLEVPGTDRLPADLGAGDVVVLAVGGRHAPVAAELGARGVSVVSVGDDLDDITELLALHDVFTGTAATLVVGAAMAPGLSGLIARHLAAQLVRCDEIHVAAHATAGPACARQHHRALRGRAIGWHDGQWIERPAGSGRELCWFPEPVGAHDCYRAALADPVLLHETFPEVTRISARLSATRRDRLTARLPMLRPPHVEGGVGALRVEVRGEGHEGERVTLVAGVAEFIGAAAAATAAAMTELVRTGGAPSGVLCTSAPELAPTALLAAVAAHGIRLQEFTGVARIG